MNAYETATDFDFMMALDEDFDDAELTWDREGCGNPEMENLDNGVNAEAGAISREYEDDDEGFGTDGTREKAIHKIEDLVLSILAQLKSSVQPFEDNSDEDEDEMSRYDTETRNLDPAGKRIEICLADRRKVLPDGSVGTRLIRYPMKGKALSAKPIAQLLRVLDVVHEALVDDVPVTKREMFYKDVPLFKTQAVVDRLVDDIAATFAFERSDLHVRASSKGLVCGSGITIRLTSGEHIVVNDSEGTLIPVGENIARFEVSECVAWVLVVEKEAVFQTMCRLSLTNHPAMPGQGIIITGKGYPDIATRQLVKTLADNLPPSIPLLALVDGDAYGIDILRVYTYGSKGMRHEAEKLAADRVRGIGVWASELPGLSIDKDTLIPITRHDEKKAYAMLRQNTFAMPTLWKKELMHMLHVRRKAEIEILSTAAKEAGGELPLVRYVARKIGEAVSRG